MAMVYHGALCSYESMVVWFYLLCTNMEVVLKIHFHFWLKFYCKYIVVFRTYLLSLQLVLLSFVSHK